MKRCLIFLVLIALTGCSHIHYRAGKSGYRRIRKKCYRSSSRVLPCEHQGGSLLIYTPSAEKTARSMNAAFLNREHKRKLAEMDAQILDASFITAFERSMIFDSVKITHRVNSRGYAEVHGFRYLYIVEKNEDRVLKNARIYDFHLDKEKTFVYPTVAAPDFQEIVNNVEDAIGGFESEASSAKIGIKYVPAIEEMEYSDTTRKGFITIKGQGLEARAWLMRKIGEICASKNKLMDTRSASPGGVYRVLDESIKDGKFTIEFEAVY